MRYQIDPFSVLGVAAVLNGLNSIAGKNSPDALRILAAASVVLTGVQMLSSVVQYQELPESVDEVVVVDVGGGGVYPWNSW
jgi:hypothetical protein